jgi:hypothetical protein
MSSLDVIKTQLDGQIISTATGIQTIQNSIVPLEASLITLNTMKQMIAGLDAVSDPSTIAWCRAVFALYDAKWSV